MPTWGPSSPDSSGGEAVCPRAGSRLLGRQCEAAVALWGCCPDSSAVPGGWAAGAGTVSAVPARICQGWGQAAGPQSQTTQRSPGQAHSHAWEPEGTVAWALALLGGTAWAGDLADSTLPCRQASTPPCSWTTPVAPPSRCAAAPSSVPSSWGCKRPSQALPLVQQREWGPTGSLGSATGHTQQEQTHTQLSSLATAAQSAPATTGGLAGQPCHSAALRPRRMDAISEKTKWPLARLGTVPRASVLQFYSPSSGNTSRRPWPGLPPCLSSCRCAQASLTPSV